MDNKGLYLRTVEEWREAYKELKNGEKLTNTALAEILGITRVHFQRLIGPDYPIDRRSLDDLNFRFRAWKVRESVMKQKDTQSKMNTDLETLRDDILSSPAYLLDRRNSKLNSEPYLVPFIDIPAQAGYTKAYNHIDYIQTLKKYPILPDVDPHGAIWHYFQIAGDSMEPEFMQGDIILTSQVPKEDWEQFKNLHTYVVVTNEDLLIKDVDREGIEDHWILLSQNPKVKPKVIPVKDVKQLWVMRRHIKARAKKARMYDIEEIRKEAQKKIKTAEEKKN